MPPLFGYTSLLHVSTRSLFGGMKVHLVVSIASLLWVIGTGRATPTEAEIGWASTSQVIALPTLHIRTPSII